MAAAPDDRLSALPDDLLQHILSFAPPKTGASTAVLSRRWRPVWLRAGALSLDSKPYAATIRATNYLEPYAYGGYIQRTSYTDSLFLPDAVKGYLQDVVDAAPALTNLVLVDVAHKPAVKPDLARWIFCGPGFRARLRLRCQTVTAFVLEASPHKEELEPWANPGIELDMPSLRSFRYKGFPVKLSLTSPTPALARVDLDVSRHEYRVQQYYEPVSRILTSFTGTRALKLRLRCIEDIVAGVILPTFPNLELLEVEGRYKYMNKHTGLAMARLLNSCPVMSELRLRLNMEYDYDYERKIGNMGGRPFAQSMERFNRLALMSSTHRDIVQLGGVSELPGSLTNNKCAFSCLQKSLRKVTLKFKAMEVNCFQVQLAKFLVENAMVLKEMQVDDGDQFSSDHLNLKLARWRSDSFQRRNLTDTAGGFRVY
uniref:F-box domain-containing protein n=1 Tax=Aegilops tauschii TaxID=37682 RepID=M8C3Z4_AEGTA